MNDDWTFGRDDDSLRTPDFADVSTPEEREGVPVVVRRGLYLNPSGSLFQIEVISRSEESIQRYASEVRMALEHSYINNIDEPSAEDEQRTDQLSQAARRRSIQRRLLSANEYNRVIVIEYVGALPAGDTASAETVNRVVKEVPANLWQAILQSEGLSLRQQQLEIFREPSYRQGYAIDFRIDPSISDGASDDYPKSCVKTARVKVTVAAGGGSVTAKTYRADSLLNPTLTVTKGGSETGVRTYSSTYNATYDLVVTDQDSVAGDSIYQVTGRWVCYYDSAPPVGGGTSCA